MDLNIQRQKAEAFRQLHDRSRPMAQSLLDSQAQFAEGFMKLRHEE